MVGAGDNWGSIYHLMNETQTTRTVYIQYTLRYQPGATATNSRPVQPWFMDVTGCGNSTYDVPGNGGPGSEHLASRSWQAPRDGMAVFAGGHLHDGGIDITVGDTGPELAGLRDERLLPREPPPPREHRLLPTAREGDRRHSYRVTARYDNSKPYADVMGIVLAYVWWGTQ